VRPTTLKPEHLRILEPGAAAIDSGLKLLDARRYEEALVCFQDGLKVFQQLVNEGHEECAAGVGLAQHYLGEALFYTGKFEECVAANDAAIEAWQRLLASGNSAFADDIAYALSAKADALLHLEQLDDALATVDESIRLVRQVLPKEPRPQIIKDLAKVENLRGIILAKLGRVKEAADACRDAAALRDSVEKR
jgi:tetratricopeptide (TPR) repeat protein